MSVQSCLLVDSEAQSAIELEEAEISDDAESFGSPQAVSQIARHTGTV